MRRFQMFRRDPAGFPENHTDVHHNAPDQVQFEGVVFTDGRVAVRWLTPLRSVSVWDSLDDMLGVHGHPEYGSELIWLDDLVEKCDEVSETKHLLSPANAVRLMQSIAQLKSGDVVELGAGDFPMGKP